MTCIIVDDEPLARKGMEMNISSASFLELKGSFANAFEAGNFLRDQPVDLIFLDINMPELSGTDFLRSLRDPPLVIFTTAYPQYALESYELDAIDYLVKPIRIERFLKAVNKAESHLRLLNQEGSSEAEVNDEFVFIKADRRFHKIYFKDILYIEGLKDYVIIHTAAAKVITSMNVKTIAAQLPPGIFSRVSKSYIINTQHITSFDNEIVYILDHEIPLGQHYKDEFQQRFVDGKIIRRS